MFIGRTDGEAEAPILWPPDAKSQLIEKDPDAWKDGRQGEKGATENEMVGWHHRLNGHECKQTPEDSEGQGSLACRNSCGHQESGMTYPLNDSNTIKKCKEAISVEARIAVTLGEGARAHDVDKDTARVSGEAGIVERADLVAFTNTLALTEAGPH